MARVNVSFMRSIAQNRLTAVGRVAARVEVIVSKSALSCSLVSAFDLRMPNATPIAAATPIAGAPRTTMTRIASATSS